LAGMFHQRLIERPALPRSTAGASAAEGGLAEDAGPRPQPSPSGTESSSAAVFFGEGGRLTPSGARCLAGDPTADPSWAWGSTPPGRRLPPCCG